MVHADATCGQALTGATAVAIVNSLWVSAPPPCSALAIGFPVAWLAGADHAARAAGWCRGGMWLVLLLPSWLPALGWERLVQPDGVMYRVGLDWPWVTHADHGPVRRGAAARAALRAVLLPGHHRRAGRARPGVRGRRPGARRGPGRHAAADRADPRPGHLSALAIGFAESISDFGVAATLAYNSNFTLATYALYAAIGNFPPSFPLAAAMGWLLVAAVAIPLALQARALRGRSYQILSGRTRQAVRRRLSPPGRRSRGGRGRRCSSWSRWASPGFGAVSGVAARRLRRLVHADPGQLPGAVARSPGSSARWNGRWSTRAITASITVIGGFIAARLLAQRRTAVDRGAGLPAAGRDRAAQRGVRARATSSPTTCRSGPGSASTCTRRRSC